jgi:O-antigen/teichoic acid export membrane protein
MEVTADKFRSKALTALRWSAVGKFSVQFFQWMMTLVVVRLLTPGDYGLMAIATLFTSFLTLINEMGLASAIVQREDLSDWVLRQVFGFVLVVNAACFVALVAASPFIASYFSEPRLAIVISVLSTQFLLMAPSVVPRAVLVRELEFRRKAFIEIASRLTAGVITIAIALAGHGVWALVSGALVGTAAETIAFLAIGGARLRPTFSFGGLRPIVAFGGIVTLQRILWFLYSQADTFLIGKRLGKDDLGYFSVSTHIASLPMQKLNVVLNQLTLPVFSRLRTDGAPVGFYALKTVRLLSFFAFPVFFGMSAVAPEAVATLLGPQWEPSALPFALLALVMPLRMVNSPISEVLNAIGRPLTLLSNVALLIVIILPAIWIGTSWGLEGVCWAWVCAFPVAFVITTANTGRVIGVSLVAVLTAMGKPALGATTMYVAVYFTRGLLPPVGEIATLGILVMVGVLIFSVYVAVADTDGLRELRTFMRTRD